MTDASTTELASRSGDGIEVSLLWSRTSDRVTVVVADVRSGERAEFAPPRHRALDAYYHPFAYAPENAGLPTMARPGPVYAR